MTPKEKADSIFQQMYRILWHTNADPIHCKECSLIAVDEILNEKSIGNLLIDWWQEVRKEIEAL